MMIDDVAEVGLAPVVVGERAVVHHLQQDVEDVRVRLLDLVQQHHAVRMLGHRLGQLAALVEADVARRRADQARHRVALHVLGHVEADQLDAEAVGELARDLGLADAGRAAEQEVADRLARIAEAGARHPDRRRPARRSPCPGRTRRSSGRGRASAARCGRRTTRSSPGCARSSRRSPRPRSCRSPSSAATWAGSSAPRRPRRSRRSPCRAGGGR